MDEKWRMERGGYGLLVKVLASKPPKRSHRTSKARRFCEVLQVLIKWSQKRRFAKIMESKVQKSKKNTDIAEENDGVTAEKIILYNKT